MPNKQNLSDEDIAQQIYTILSSAADALEAIPSPCNSALDEILEEIWAQIDRALLLFPQK